MMEGAREPVTWVRSRVVLLPRDDVDTDQIIPARYLKVTDKNGLGDGLFANWRGDPELALNQPALEDARILLAGANFGCGSSREHAVWALLARGFRVVVARSFADIFAKNSHKNGLLLVEVGAEAHSTLSALCADDPTLELTVDLENERVVGADRSWPFTIDPFARHCLLAGMDELDYLMSFVTEIAQFEASGERSS